MHNAAAALLAVLLATPLFAQTHNHSSTLHKSQPADPPPVACPANIEHLMRKAVEELVLRDNPNAEDAEIKAHIGTICNMVEYMADIAILVEVGKGQYRFGIFHMHFSHEGWLNPTSGSSAVHWSYTDDRDYWHARWCNYLQKGLMSYREELEKYGCKN